MLGLREKISPEKYLYIVEWDLWTSSCILAFELKFHGADVLLKEADRGAGGVTAQFLRCNGSEEGRV